MAAERRPYPPRMLRALAVAVAAAVLAGCGGDDKQATHAAASRAKQARELADRAGLPADIGEFLASAARAPAATYTVDYELQAEGGTAVLAQQPPNRRVDVTVGEGETRVVQSAIVNEDGSFSCLKARDRWRCDKAPSAATPGRFSVGDVRRTTEELAKAKDAYDFVVEARLVAGQPARCLVTTLKPGQTPDPSRGPRGVLCISREGVPLLAEGGRNQFRATRYRTSANDDAFDLPAEPR